MNRTHPEKSWNAAAGKARMVGYEKNGRPGLAALTFTNREFVTPWPDVLHPWRARGPVQA
jgi:hypothetical protein